MIRRPPRSTLFPYTRSSDLSSNDPAVSASPSVFSVPVRGTQDVAVTYHPAVPGSLDSGLDRKSTRLNSSHSQISYAVFCLKKKKFPDVSKSTFHAARVRATA